MVEPSEKRGRQVRLTSIEACRGVAATLVMASHCAHTLGAPANFGVAPFGLAFQFGRAGADIFFVLSGFLISFIHAEDLGRPARFGHYLLRRLTRIYPTYWLVLLLVVPGDLVTHTLYDKYDQPIELLKNLLLLPQSDPLLDVTWSLRNELLFYALFGVAILNRNLGAALLMTWLAVLAASPYIGGLIDTPALNLLTYPMNFEFLAGVAAGWLVQQRLDLRPRLLLGCGIALFALFAVAEDLRYLWSNEVQLWRPGASWDILMLRSAGYGLASVLFITGLAVLERARRIRAPAALIRLGDASYLLYLIHIPALLILGASERRLHLLHFAPPWLLATAYMLIIMGGAIGLNMVVEKPLLRWVRPPRTAAPTAPALS